MEHAMTPQDRPDARAVIVGGRAVLGIELGSTRIKAVLVDPDGNKIASGGHAWENQFVDRTWTYSQDAIWSGVQACFESLRHDTERKYAVQPNTFGGLGISAMMHGYLAFDKQGELLVPFRTWRNTSTEQAASELTDLFGYNIPFRWSSAHLYQSILNNESHVPQVDFLTTLAGYVHWCLTGRKVLGVGDASGMFPIDPETKDFDSYKLAQFDALVGDRHPDLKLARLLPQVLLAGQEAGQLTEEGAALLDPTGLLQPGLPMCPPEGDAGTGMVATNAVAPRTGNVSVGTSIFAMSVLERPLGRVHPEVDMVTTPAGDLVAMVHCNNGASEIAAWAEVFGQFAAALGHQTDPDEVFGALLREGLAGEADGGGLLAYNYLSGEPITRLAEGRPLFVRTPDSRLTLANFVRTQIYGAFGTLSLGMQVLAEEGVEVDVMIAHGGLFRTEGVAQRLLAAALGTSVAVGQSAGEGGAWGIAVLASYLGAAHEMGLAEFLDRHIFAKAHLVVVEPNEDDMRGFADFLVRYRAGLSVELTATTAI